ncbi:hypothetical protein OS493_035333 [Desmophyllum pertusum]|uniref:Uncharacterized protein n=1 Tax=Desmophyllum pertusum TaxID=174260 RepID=A0A9X0CE92_9CNID|nr:hypothetical protein OS493_035333 [Desmophyllum pertusum]
MRIWLQEQQGTEEIIKVLDNFHFVCEMNDYERACAQKDKRWRQNIERRKMSRALRRNEVGEKLATNPEPGRSEITTELVRVTPKEQLNRLIRLSQ